MENTDISEQHNPFWHALTLMRSAAQACMCYPTYVECTTIRARAAKKRYWTLMYSRFLHKFWNGKLKRNFIICFSNFQQGTSSWERKEVNMSITVSPEFSFWLSWHHIRQRVCGLLLHLEEIHILFSFDIKTLRNLLPFSIVWISWQINLRLMENRLKRKKGFPLRKVASHI